jgi:hypothetical protein
VSVNRILLASRAYKALQTDGRGPSHSGRPQPKKRRAASARGRSQAGESLGITAAPCQRRQLKC